MVRRILLIDHDQKHRELLERMLTRHGHEVALAANGKWGLRHARASMPDVIITEILMPEQDGLEVILEIKALNPAARIVAISGGSRTFDRKYILGIAKKLGADWTLEKPVDETQLLEAVETVTKRCGAGR